MVGLDCLEDWRTENKCYLSLCIHTVDIFSEIEVKEKTFPLAGTVTGNLQGRNRTA